MIRNTKKAFTLVELIVVITILAILGTIAFISLQGYSGDAKNSKVTSDLRNIASAIESATTRNSITLASISSWSTIANNWVNTALTIWSPALALSNTWSVTYQVWNVNFAAIQQNGADFRDPNANNANYIYAMVNSATFKGYQLAWQIIVNDVKRARINWTFYQASGANATWLISGRIVWGSNSTTPLIDNGQIGWGATDSLY